MVSHNREKDLFGREEIMPIFKYGQGEIDHLKSKDKKLGAAIEKIGRIEREITPDVFSALVQSIISQQISAKAAQTVSVKMRALMNGVLTPEGIMQAGAGAIKECGLSNRKAGYITGIAEAALAGTVDFGTLHVLTDEEIISKLTALKGVGVWTAEMLLIFSLCRPNVISYGDLAIRRGMMNLYGLRELSKDKFEKYRRRYSPYGSVASLYLWALANNDKS